MSTAALLPVKRFADAKRRLAATLPDAARAHLARALADGVVAALDVPVFVACDDEEVATWARTHGAEVVWTPALGLDGAVAAGLVAVAAAGHDHALVAHADLVDPGALTAVARPGWITLVPDRHGDGTNVLSTPLTPEAPVRPAYGPASFARHLHAARVSGLPYEVRRDPRLAFDVDTPADLTHPLVAARLSRLLPPPEDPR